MVRADRRAHGVTEIAQEMPPVCDMERTPRTLAGAVGIHVCVFRRIRPGVSVESAHRFGETAHPNCKLVGAGAEAWIYVMKVVGLVAKHRP